LSEIKLDDDDDDDHTAVSKWQHLMNSPVRPSLSAASMFAFASRSLSQARKLPDGVHDVNAKQSSNCVNIQLSATCLSYNISISMSNALPT
jgi:hypothetical protein